MAKITSRQELVQYADELHLTASPLYLTDETNSGVLKHFNDFPYRAIETWLQTVYAKADGFDAMPDEFFVNAIEVTDKYHYNDYHINQAIQYSCINNANFWVFREFLRFRSREYSPAPCIQALATGNQIKPELSLHFPHASVEDPTMLAYTPSYEYGIRDRQVRIKVGKYLQRYYSDVLTSEQIRAFANGSKGYTLKWARDKDEMREVYRDGPRSCMAGGVSSFDTVGDYHPVDVYATGDFALAYLTTVNDTIVARGFVYEPERIWVRTYGDEAQALADDLEAQGYSRSSTWAGCLIKRIEDDDGRIVLPYLDGDDKGVKQHSPQFFIITDSNSHDYYCDFTSGVVDEEPYSTCTHCGGDLEEHEANWSNYHEAYIGDCCIESYRNAHYHRHCQTLIHEDRCIYCESNGEWYEEDYARECGIVETASGEWYKVDDVVESIDGEYIHDSDAVCVGNDRQYDHMVYVEDVYHPDVLLDFDPAPGQPNKAWHYDFMPDCIREAFENDQQLVDDFGVQYGKRFRTMAQVIMLAESPRKALDCLHDFGFMGESTYSLVNKLCLLNRLPAPATATI